MQKGRIKLATSKMKNQKQGEFPIDYRVAMEQFERRFIKRALILHRGNVSKTARSLNIGRRNLQLKIRHYDIDISKIRRGTVVRNSPTRKDILQAIAVLSQVVNL